MLKKIKKEIKWRREEENAKKLYHGQVTMRLADKY